MTKATRALRVAGTKYMAIQTFTLDNGMQVLLEENRTSPVVSFNALVRAGSAIESNEESGMCHLIEHMLFKGTPSRPAGTIARDVEAAGGEINAYTSLDQTVFYINMATRFSKKGLAILADAVQHPLFDEQELLREKEVVLEEIRREQDNPGRMVIEHLFDAAYKKHAYRRPIIGFPATVKSFTRNQILDFYHRWYAPKNMVFIAVGDFETKRMLEEIRRYFDRFKGPEAPKAPPPAEPAQDRLRLVVKKMNIQSTYLALGFHIPAIIHPDVPAMDVLGHVMGGSESSRLEQEIKEKRRLAHHIYAYAFTPKDPGLLVVGATLADQDAPLTIDAVRQEIERIREEPITSEELSRAKVSIRSNEIYDRETVGGQAAKLATFLATAGSHEFERRYYQMLADVNTHSVREVARRYLAPDKATAVLLVPGDSKWLKSKGPLASALAPTGKGRRVKPPTERPAPRKIQLKNGATMILIENHSLPIIAVNAAALGGLRYETKSNNGVSALMARLLTKGTTQRSAVSIAKEMERLAGHIEGVSGRNIVGLKCEFLSEHLHDGLTLFADVLTHPAFSSQQVAKEKRHTLKVIKDQEDILSTLVFNEFLKRLFPRHPYGLRMLGSKESVRRLGPADIKRFHTKVARASGVVITIAGDFNPAEVEKLANELLVDLPKGRPTVPKIKPEPRPTEPRSSQIIKKEKQQAHIMLGFMGTTFTSADRYAMTVLNNILAGQGGRLFLTLRDKMSLAYAVSLVNQAGIDPGCFAVYIGTDPGKVDTAIGAINRELEHVCQERVSPQELERSKQFLVGTYELDTQRNSSLANIYVLNELYGLGLGEFERYPQQILKVTRDDVLRAAKRHIDLKAYTLAVVKPA